ncbi:DNA polymerase IV [Candidatus Gracilibacteria bacterium]|nr:DNA polymerase IV [Candidatus Gracilibacteria bacterium]
MTSLHRAIAHVDADCFFASVEIALRPELQGKPVLVCSRVDERGIVLAASYEARRPGIRAGTPLFKARPLCPEGIYIPGRFEHYQESSHHIMRILRRFTPHVQPCSIDEAFIDITGLRILYKTTYLGIGSAIKAAVKKEVGVNVSIGIASSKLLAKMASDASKPNGLLIIREREREEFLRKMPINTISGVGPNTTAYLKKLGMHYAYDIATATYIPRVMGKHLKEIQDALCGIETDPIEHIYAPPQSLSCTRTFPQFTADKKYIYQFSLSLLLKATHRLRSYGMETKEMRFFLGKKDFKVITSERNFLLPTNDEHILIDTFKGQFQECFEEGVIYRKAGIIMPTLFLIQEKQLSLFNEPQKQIDNDTLFHSLDQLQGKYGLGIIKRASLLTMRRK